MLLSGKQWQGWKLVEGRSNENTLMKMKLPKIVKSSG